MLARRAHMVEHFGRRPAIDMQPIGLLIRAERGAGFHAGLAVDLVAVDAQFRQPLLHAFDVGGFHLHNLAPRCLKWPWIGNPVGHMADEENVQVREIVFLDDEVVLRHEK